MDARRTCTACRSAKVKCDRQSPVCGRWVLSQPYGSLIYKVRKQGRPSATGGCGLGGMGVGHGGGSGGSLAHQGGQGGGESGGLINDFILQTFQKLLHNQVVDTNKTLKVLQVTSLLGSVFKTDYLGGLSTKLQFFMRVSLTSLKDTPEVHAEMAALEDNLNLRWKEGNVVFGSLPPQLQALDDRVSMVACITAVCGAAMRVTCNHHFSELLCSPKELYQCMQTEPISPFVVWAMLVASEDRLDFLEALTKHCFCSTEDQELSQIVKIKGRNDATNFLAVVRLRMVVLGNGRYVSIIFNATPAPSSKYLRGGNRDVEPSSVSGMASANLLGGFGLNMIDSSFRCREPSPSLQDLKPDFVHTNLDDERVRVFLQQSLCRSNDLSAHQQQQQPGGHHHDHHQSNNHHGNHNLHQHLDPTGPPCAPELSAGDCGGGVDAVGSLPSQANGGYMHSHHHHHHYQQADLGVMAGGAPGFGRHEDAHMAEVGQDMDKRHQHEAVARAAAMAQQLKAAPTHHHPHHHQQQHHPLHHAAFGSGGYAGMMLVGANGVGENGGRFEAHNVGMMHGSHLGGSRD